MRYLERCVVAGGVVLALAWAVSPAKAQSSSQINAARLGSTIVPNGSVVPEFSAGSVTFREGNGNTTRIGHTWDAQPSRQTRLNETYRVAVGGNQIDWTRRSTVPPLSISRAAAAAIRALPYVSAGVLAWELYSALRIRPDGSGGLAWDAGAAPTTTPPTTTTQYIICSGQGLSINMPACNGTPTGMGGGATGGPKVSAAAACSAYMSWISTNPGASTVFISSQVANTCVVGARYSGAGPYYMTGNIGTISATTPGSTFCPASIDPFDPQYNVPEGLPAGPDGLCAKARGHHGTITVDNAAARLEQYSPPNGDTLKTLAQDSLERGESIQGISSSTGTGPGSVTGTPTTTTTTHPSGTTTTTTKTPTTNYSYTGDTVNYNITNVTVTNENGVITTTVESETPEPEEACKTAPDSLGCTKLGTPPTDGPTWSTVNVPFAAEDLGFTGACPAPVQWVVRGMDLSWSYQPLCDIAPMIRVALLLLASIGAVSIVIRETSS